MIWSSVLAMTVVDLLVVGAVTGLFMSVFRMRAVSFSAETALAPKLILAGLACIALFHGADLVVMLLLPAFFSEVVITNWMTLLHLDARWMITLLSLALLCTGFMLELIARRASQQALAVSEARYRSIVQDQAELIVRWQPGGILTFANDAYCEHFGQPRETLIGTSFFPRIADSDRQRVEDELGTLTKESPSRSGIHEVKLPDGSPGWQEWTDRALFDDTGRLIEIQSVGRDITDRVRAAAALERSESRFRGFVENTSDWVWEVDSTGRHRYSNRQVERLLGYTPAEMAELDLADIIHPEDFAKVRAWLPEHVAEKRGWKQWLVRFRRRDGSYRYLESTADPVIDVSGNVVGFRGIDRDATFQTLIAQISTDFVGRAATDLDARIERALGQIGICYGLDRISFWWFESEYVRRSHEWARDGMSGPKHALQVSDELPWAGSLLCNRQVVRIESLDEVPPGVPDIEFFKAQSVKSSLAIPLLEQGALIGIGAFSTVVKPRKWSEAVESELRLLAEKIAAAHSQAEAVRNALRRERDLAHSESLAHVGSFSFYPVLESGEFPDGWIISFSREQCALFEVEPENASYELLISRVHEDDRERVMRQTEEVLRDGREIETVFRLRNPSGRIVHLANHTHVDRDEDGNIVRVVGANRDITEQVRRERSLTKALAEIEDLKNRLEAENVELRQEIRSANEFEQVIGDSAALKNCLDLVAKVAPTDASVLILGETGTGKELIARAVHELSRRSKARLVSINCSALPAELVESELFGHERGAFTGAHRRREGRFEAANGGTLFLDEIAELPLHLQGKLLRVLQDGDYERVGGTETLHADIRLVAATNRNLDEAVEKGEFRADLYYRINTIPIRLPPLRERKEDIPQLAQHFVRKHGPRFGKAVEHISTRMLAHLQQQDWPGNVRELEHYIERSLISATGPVLMLDEADSGTIRTPAVRQRRRAHEIAADLRSVERDHILHVLEDTEWTIGGEQGAAARLGLPPSTLRSKMKKLGIRRVH